MAPRPHAKRRKPVPTILQIEQTECGVACLAMILASYGMHIGLERLREMAGVSRDGTRASNLLKAARRVGLTAKGFRKEPEQLHEVPWPAILHWNFNHFVVLEGLNASFAYLNDPATGRRKIPLDELRQAFTGVVIACEPGADFEPSGAQPSVLSALAERLAGTRALLPQIIIASGLLVVPGVALPVLSRIFVDDILTTRQTDWIIPFTVLLATITLAQAALVLLQQMLLARLEVRLAFLPATKMLWHMLRLPMSFYAQRHPGELANRLDANEKLASLLSGQFATSIFNLLSMIVYAGVMLLLDPVLAVAIILLQCIYFLTLSVSNRLQSRNARLQAAQSGKLIAATVGAIRAIETIKASATEREAFQRWAGHQARLLSLRSSQGRVEALIGIVPGLLSALSAAAVLGLGGLRVMDGAISLGTLIAFQALAVSFYTPIASLVQLAGQIQMVKADIDRADDLMRAPAAHFEAEDATLASFELRAEDLVFGYSPLDPPFVNGFSLTLRPGARVALVGGSGSGKSTVGRLLAGLFTPWSGTISIGGIGLNELDPARRAAICGYVDQEIFLFEGTVEDNLSLWDPGVSDRRLIRALSDAAVLDDVIMRKGQLLSQVNEGGTNFSGGQRQRLEIARVLAAEPSIVILDEATSALDPATEKRIDDNLRARGCTTIIIAHRLSTIRDCDEIIVMKDGRIVERGDHETLMAAAGEYAALIAEGAGHG